MHSFSRQACFSNALGRPMLPLFVVWGIKHRAKIELFWIPGRLFWGPEAVLKRTCDYEASRTRPGAPRGRPGRPQDPFFEPPEGGPGSQIPLKIIKNCFQETLEFGSIFGFPFLSISDAFLAPKFIPKSMMFRFHFEELDVAKNLIFLRFL